MNCLQSSRLAPQPNRLTKVANSCPSLHPTLLGFAARSSQHRQLALILRAAKGFGKTKKQSSSKSPANGDREPTGGKARKGEKRARLNPTDIGPIPGQNQSPQQLAPQLLAPTPLQPATEEDEDFLSRLQALKAASKDREAAAAAATASSLATSSSENAAAASPAIFDALTPPCAGPDSNGNDNIYANPPPLAATLLAAAGGGDATSGISDPKLRDAAIGPNQLGLAVGAIVFVAVFVVAAAADYAPSSRRYAGVRPAQAPPDGIEEKILKSRVALYEDQLKVDPNNDDATEALATSYAKMLQYDKAAALLEKLTKRNPDDAEAWRLLGESALLSQQPRKAVPALERAVQLRREQAAAAAGAAAAVTQPDLQLLTGLVDSYIANSEYGKAIETLRGVRKDIATASAAATAASTAEATAAAGSSVAMTVEDVAAVAAPAMLTAPPLTDDAADGTAAAAPSTPDEASVSSTTQSESQPQTQEPVLQSQQQQQLPAVATVRPLDPVGVELLTAKVFSAWRGHDQDALGTYDELIKAYPEDYRGYLAKGVFLKEKGRKADAERMFLQARFFAPASRQQLVRAIADSTPALQLPDNN